MNKTAIKNFAIWARNKLRADIILKAGLLGITDKGIAQPLPQSTNDLQLFDIGTSQPVRLEGKTAIDQRNSLVTAIRAKQLKHAEAFDAVIEEVAYTWFNRLIAVRFMEVNDYLPGRVRVLSSENPAKAEPDFVTNPFDTDLDFTEDEINLIDNLKDNNKSDELFQFLFIKQCNKLNEILPELFEKTNDYTELLLNVSFTDKDGVVYHLVHDISEDDFNIEKQGQVEIIGWLYQYYNTEPKDKVFGRPSGQKIRKEDVPAATQLFTPDWIVRYMVENSLGRIYCSKQFSSTLKSQSSKSFREVEKEIADEMGWKYYLPEAEQTPEVDQKLNEERSKLDALDFEKTTFLDPCMGSGHILVYAFDVFMNIYTAQGYTERDAAQRIVEKNLYGLELDDRAAQLAYFAVMMKARSYDRRFLTRGIRPNLCSIQESNSLNTDYLELFGDLKPTAQKLVDEFIDAKEYGSILNLKITADEITQLESKFAEIDDTIYDNFFDTIRQVGLRTVFVPLLRQAKIMVRKYEVVCTNPPYMSVKSVSKKLSAFIKKQYQDSKVDLFAVFMEKCSDYTKKCYYTSMITMHAWMFLSSFEKLRKKMLNQTTINMAHLGARAFDQIGGEVVQTTTFVNRKEHITNYQSLYKRLIELNSEKAKQEAFFDANYNYSTSPDLFFQIPSAPIAYWKSKQLIESFKNELLEDELTFRQGMSTTDNNKYLRMWSEVSLKKIGFGYKSREEAASSDYKWFPYQKGGEFRRWYGNNDYVVFYLHDGQELIDLVIKKYPNISDPEFVIKNRSWFFKEGLTWSTLSSGHLGVRYCYGGFIFDAKGSMAFTRNATSIHYYISLLNSCVADTYLDVLTPTLDFNIVGLKNVPFILKDESTVRQIVENAIKISKNDWDSFETSWDFKKHPFLAQSSLAQSSSAQSSSAQSFELKANSSLIADCFDEWKTECETRFNQLKANEEELNRIFIDIYGLQDELTPEVEDKDVTVRKADLQRDMRSFVSYAVGCMFGRYSLDREGLVFAGGDWELAQSSKLKAQSRDSEALSFELEALSSTFLPDEDNCIPITDTAYFEDDIVGRFVEFVKAVFGEGKLEENLAFIAKALGNKGNTSRDIIRNYFLNDFFKDHCKIYQKRPIYWLFDSGKQNGFKALVYMHRWNADTIGNVRVEYLHRLQHTYEKEIEREQDTIDNTKDAREKAASEKRKEKLLKQLKETRDYDTMISHLALSRIDIDLDDGVKVNYEKVQTAKDGKKLQILAKI